MYGCATTFTLPAFVDTSNWNGDITGPFCIDAFGELNIVWDIPVGGLTTIQVNATDEVYIGRSDGTRSNRTITVRFDFVPGPLLGGPPPGTGPVPEQRTEAVLDALNCPQQDQPGVLDTLGIAIAIDDTTQFEAESCADLAGLVASGMSFLVEVRIREDETGALAAAAVAFVPDSGGRGHGHGRGGSRQPH